MPAAGEEEACSSVAFDFAELARDSVLLIICDSDFKIDLSFMMASSRLITIGTRSLSDMHGTDPRPATFPDCLRRDVRRSIPPTEWERFFRLDLFVDLLFCSVIFFPVFACFFNFCVFF